MVVSEISIYEFLTQQLHIEDALAKRYVADIVRAEEKLEKKIEEKIDQQFDSSKEEIIMRLETKIAENKTDILKWMVSFFIGLFVALIATFAGILSLVLK